MRNTEFNLVIVGVGGQGTLLASRILGRLAVEAGQDVKVSEVHGMSQRGGSVITYVRAGEKIASPMVALGDADYLLSFEALEAVRAANYLKPHGVVITNTQQISPMPVITGTAAYPEKVLDLLPNLQVLQMNALDMAEKSGSAKTVNLVLLGALSNHLHYSLQQWETAIVACVPPKTLQINLKAFHMGRNADKSKNG